MWSLASQISLQRNGGTAVIFEGDLKIQWKNSFLDPGLCLCSFQFNFFFFKVFWNVCCGNSWRCGWFVTSVCLRALFVCLNFQCTVWLPFLILFLWSCCCDVLFPPSPVPLALYNLKQWQLFCFSEGKCSFLQWSDGCLPELCFEQLFMCVELGPP